MKRLYTATDTAVPSRSDEGIFMISCAGTPFILFGRSAMMANMVPDWKTVLSVMSEAFSTGDNPRGEELLWSALDAGAPWDVATSTVAQALSARMMAESDADGAASAPA